MSTADTTKITEPATLFADLYQHEGGKKLGDDLRALGITYER